MLIRILNSCYIRNILMRMHVDLFINYDKSDDIQDTLKYEDHFTSRSSLM